MRKFLQNDKGAIAIMFAILMPFLIYILWLGFDGSSLLLKHSRQDDASREANLASSTLKDKSEKEDVAQKFLFTYFDNDTDIKVDEFEDIEIEDSNGTKKATKFSSEMKNETFFVPDADIEQELKTDANSIVGEANFAGNGGNTDYAFAIDFSSSMSDSKDTMFLLEEVDKLCRTYNEDYDASFCKKARLRITNLNMAQAVVQKVLKILAKHSADTVTYSIVPFSTVTQASRRHNYTISNAYPNSKQLITPFVFKNKFRLSDMSEYDKYSRTNKIEAKDGRFIFSSLLPSDLNKKKIEDLFYTIFTSSSGYDGPIYFNTRINHALDTIVDYRESINKVFDLEAGFGFRLSSPELPKNPIWYVKIEKDAPYTAFPKRRTISDGKNPSRDFLAAETPLKPLNKIKDYDENPITDPDDLENINSIITDYGTDIIVGLMRGAAHLGGGKNSRRVLIVVTDGESKDSYSTDSSIPYTASKFISYGLCDEIKNGLIKRGANKVEIIFFIIGDEKKGKRFKKDIKKCTDEKNIIFAENLENFFKDFKKVTLGEGSSPNFIYKKLK